MFLEAKVEIQWNRQELKANWINLFGISTVGVQGDLPSVAVDISQQVPFTRPSTVDAGSGSSGSACA